MLLVGAFNSLEKCWSVGSIIPSIGIPANNTKQRTFIPQEQRTLESAVHLCVLWILVVFGHGDIEPGN